MTVTVAVVGAGRMGSVVAAQLPGATCKIIIDNDADKARRLAEKIGGNPSSKLERADGADMVFLVLPTPAINPCIGRLVKIVPSGCMILNMATTAHVEAALIEQNRQIPIINARIIGHAMSITRGEPGIVVVACDDELTFSRIRDQLPGFHQVVRGDADRVEMINSISSTEGLRTALIVKQKLGSMDIPDDWIDVAVRTVCAGTMKSYIEDDLGHFARRLVQQLEAEIRSMK